MDMVWGVPSPLKETLTSVQVKDYSIGMEVFGGEEDEVH